MRRWDRDVFDALMVGAFFIGYAVALAVARRVPRPAITLDPKRLTFFRGMRDALISEENMASPTSVTSARVPDVRIVSLPHAD
jgi:hypothetical protein